MSFKVLTACWFAWFWIWSVRILIPTLMPEIQGGLVLSTSEVSVMLGTFNISVGIGFYLFGIMGNKFSKRRIVLCGVLFSIIALLGFTFVGYYLAMLLTITAGGLGLGAYLPNATAVLSEVFPRTKRGSALGLHETAAPVGQSIGSLLVWVGSGIMAWQGVISVWTLFGLIPLLFLGAYFYDQKPTPVTYSGSAVTSTKWGLRQTLYLAMAYISVQAGITGFLSIMPIYMVNEFGLGIGFVAFILGVTKITGSLGQVAGGRLSDKYGRKPILLFITGVVAVTTTMLSFLPFSIIFVGALFAQFLAGAAFFPVAMAGVSDHTTMAERSGKIGFLLFLSSIVGAGVTPVAIGFTAERVGYQMGFLFPIALTFAGVLSVYFLNLAPQT